MKIYVVFVFLLLFGIIGCSNPSPEIHLFLVRHAEKDTLHEGNNPPLTQVGLERAERLKTRLQQEGITQIYSTDYIRTRATVKPLQESLQLPLFIYEYDAFEPCLDAIRLSEKTTLLCGHSDNLLPMINYLNGQPPVARIEHNDYHYFFKLTLRQDTTLVEVMHF